MPIINLTWDSILELLDLPTEKIIGVLTDLGIEVEETTQGLSLEVLPNRPDLYSIEGIARTIKIYLGTAKFEYTTKSSDVILRVDYSVEEVRPYIVGALVKNLQFTDTTIKSSMDLQEKLHFTIGRKRKRAAIGIHDFGKIKPPFVYRAEIPTEVSFIPLGMDRMLTLSEILRYHDKGIEYRYILENFKKYPIIVDSDNQILSFPPIINANLTTVTKDTTDVFIEITGTDFNALNIVLNVLCTGLADRGGEIYTIDVLYRQKKVVSPNFTQRSVNIDVAYVNSILGTSLSRKDICKSLEMMGFTVEKGRGTQIGVAIPVYRSDILHPIDLVEDVAISIGYENIPLQLPKVLTFGKKSNIEIFSEKLRRILTGLGFIEVTTLTLSCEKTQFERMNLTGSAVLILNPITQEHTCLRTSLIPSLLEILSANQHHHLPQNLFEIGDVATPKLSRKVSGVIIHSKANFTSMKSIVECILKNVNVQYSIVPKTHGSFIQGRCASVIANTEIGHFGEIHPQVITNFNLEYPIIAFELDVERLMR